MKNPTYRLKRVIFLPFILLTLILLSGCATNGSKEFFEYSIDPTTLPPEVFLQEGEEPEIYYSSDPYSDVTYMMSNFYYILGSSYYNGPSDSYLENEIKTFAKEIGAKVAIYSYDYSYTDTRVTGNSYGVYTNKTNRYDYIVYFLVPMPASDVEAFSRIGLSYGDLDVNERDTYHRNTGAIIGMVFERTPAFDANFSRNDIIIGVNDIPIRDASELTEVFALAEDGQTLKIDLIRDNQEMTIDLTVGSLF